MAQQNYIRGSCVVEGILLNFAIVGLSGYRDSKHMSRMVCRALHVTLTLM